VFSQPPCRGEVARVQLEPASVVQYVAFTQ
jgi:hypothetical protein